MPTKLRTFEYNYSMDSTILSQNKYLNITQIFNICSKVLVALTPIQISNKVKGNQAYLESPLSDQPPWRSLASTD